jgi:hypothetical protein
LVGTNHKTKAPPRATPPIAMTTVRNGNCSTRIGTALFLLAVGEAAFEVELALVPVPEGVPEEVPEEGRPKVTTISERKKKTWRKVTYCYIDF